MQVYFNSPERRIFVWQFLFVAVVTANANIVSLMRILFIVFAIEIMIFVISTFVILIVMDVGTFLFLDVVIVLRNGGVLLSKKVSVLAPNELANWNSQHDCMLFEIPEGCKDLIIEGDLDKLFTYFERVFSKEMCSESDSYALCIFKLFHSKIIDGLIVRRLDYGEYN